MADSIEIGTSRTTRVIGRDLAHATERHLVTDVTLDGERVAVVLPAGLADHTPNRAELDALMGHLMTRMGPAFSPHALIGETDLLGRALGEFCDSGADVLAVAEAALTELNMHGQAGAVRAARGRAARGIPLATSAS